MIDAADIVVFVCALVLVGIVALALWAILRGLYEMVVVGLRAAGRLPPRRSQASPTVPPPLPAEVRAWVIARDEFACVECGATEDLTVDHIYPKVRGGSNDESNLRTLCRHCNSRKGKHVYAANA